MSRGQGADCQGGKVWIANPEANILTVIVGMLKLSPNWAKSGRISYIRKEKYRPATPTTTAAVYVCHAQGTPPGF